MKNKGGRPRETVRLSGDTASLEVLERLADGKLSYRQASDILGVSPASLHRLKHGKHISQLSDKNV